MCNCTPLILAALLFPLCLCKCASGPNALPTRPSPDVSRILESLKECKDDLKSFRGVGTLKTVRGTSAKTFRMWWIGSEAQNLRVETVGPWGQPTLTFVINGSSFFLYSRRDNRYFKGDATVRNLSRFVSMPVRPEDLIRLLSGQTPILPFHHAKIRAPVAEEPRLLSLHDKWGRVIEKIWLKHDANTVEQIEVFDGWGELQYRVTFNEFHQMESLCLPHRIAISDRQGPLWSLTVEKLWTNVVIPDGAYTLEVSDSEVVDLDS